MNDRFRGMLKVLRSDMEKLQGQYDVIGNEAKTQLETLRKSTEGLEASLFASYPNAGLRILELVVSTPAAVCSILQTE